MNKIYIKDIHFKTVIGVYNIDREKPQDLYIDITLTYDRTEIADDIKTTINYADVVDLVTGYIENNQPQLIETVGEYIANACLGMTGVQEAVVEVKKPSALPNGIPSVIISKSK